MLHELSLLRQRQRATAAAKNQHRMLKQGMAMHIAMFAGASLCSSTCPSKNTRDFFQGGCQALLTALQALSIFEIWHVPKLAQLLVQLLWLPRPQLLACDSNNFSSPSRLRRLLLILGSVYLASAMCSSLLFRAQL